MNKYIKVINNQIVGYKIELTGTYVTDTGETICGVEHLSDDEKHALNFYPMTEFIPAYDSSYQNLTNPTYTVLADSVELRYDVENNTEIYTELLTKRLSDFAKQKDIDLSEIATLMFGTNEVWKAEATKLLQLYEQTWQAFYDATSSDWREIEATLPVLSW